MVFIQISACNIVPLFPPHCGNIAQRKRFSVGFVWATMMRHAQAYVVGRKQKIKWLRSAAWREGCAGRTIPELALIASRLLFVHAPSCSTERLWSLLRWVYRDNRSRLSIEKARKMALISMFNRSDESDMDVFQDDLQLDSLICMMTQKCLMSMRLIWRNNDINTAPKCQITFILIIIHLAFPAGHSSNCRASENNRQRRGEGLA